MKLHYYFFIFLVVLSGCELYTQDDFEEHYVVESYLIANAPLPNVRVSHTLPLEEQYSFEKTALNNASVEIRLVDTGETFTFNLQSDGVYSPADFHTVKPEGVYELHVSFSNGDIVRSTTRVPGDFNTVNDPEGEYVYQKEQVEITVDSSAYPGRQSYYVFTINAVNPSEEKLTPFYRDIIEDQDGSISNFYVNSSGIVNEGNYEQDENGFITLNVPWLAIAFSGPNDIIANAIDDNMYDFIRSQDVQTGGSTLPPGEIQNISYNVEGGIGIFGSMASDTNRVVIVTPESE